MVCRGAPKLSHLLFDDDYFLFCNIKDIEVKALKVILNTYGKAYGQLINPNKSKFFFSTNTQHSHRKRISSFLGIKDLIGKGKYLGLPSLIGRNKKVVFDFLKDKVWKCINHWSSKHLSKAGKETLIKSCA